ncbi:MAG: ArsR family transcriptional regulator [Candidatus Micrarchaeota archaeon]|nr:ArsR family transcriptional regulator [Candidatus Micrarchaeota archaeon]
MSKHGSTKDRILKLISEGTDNLSVISVALGLAPSTVSKHLKDLEDAGVIEQKNSHVRKWKYYRLANTSGLAISDIRVRMASRANMAVAIAVGLGVLALIGYLYAYGVLGSTYVPVSITDPPQVPFGTEALYINYSSLSVHTGGAGNGTWIPMNSSGRLDLMSLINESQVIGGASMRVNSRIDAVRFNISSASIEVNNLTYPVSTASRQITAFVSGNSTVKANYGVMLDFSPVVTTIYTDNSTLFLMLPSAKAVVAEGQGERMTRTQYQGMIERQVRSPLKPSQAALLFRANPTIKVSGVLLSSSQNRTSLSVTLDNNGSRSITVRGVLLLPNQSPGMRQQRSEEIQPEIISVKGANMYFMLGHLDALGLIAYPNGTLGMPSPDTVSRSGSGIGYELQPAGEATLSYNGTLSLAGGRLNLTLPGNSVYTVLVVTNAGVASISGVSTT